MSKGGMCAMWVVCLGGKCATICLCVTSKEEVQGLNEASTPCGAEWLLQTSGLKHAELVYWIAWVCW